MTESALHPSLLRAYRAAHYALEGRPWMLHEGQPQPQLLALYQRHAVQCATYFTAVNPLGELLPDATNARRMQQLRADLQRAGWAWLNGQALDPDGEWPAEDSVLVLGMNLHTARAWGQQWQQNAVLHCNAQAVPQLVLLR